MGSTKWIVWMVVAAVVVFISSQFMGKEPTGATIYDDFAQCVTDSGAKMYGAYWCPHCKEQKERFDNSQFIPYVECDPRGDKSNPAACEAAGVESYPTWVFSNGERSSGALPLSEIAFRSECDLPA